MHADVEWGGVTSPGRLGQAIRDVRSLSGVSLRELSRRIGVSAATVSAIETGRTQVSVSRLQVIAGALQTTAAELIDRATGSGCAAPVPAETAQPPRPALDMDKGVDCEGADWRYFAPLRIDPVLSAAIAVFVETGYHGATVRTIAHRAGMSVPGVYHHYRSKQELLAKILDLAMTELLWRVPAARNEGATPTERVGLIVESMALFHTHRRELAFIGSSEMRSLELANRRRIAGLRNHIQYILDREIDEAVREGSLTTDHPRDGARAISTMCTSLPQWFRADGPRTPEQIAAEYARFALDLLGHREGWSG
ncbi:TetR family transcriptional regulator [Streptomyces sp. NPDC056390]|uniref:TetR family transcriptional regulator n=1 Tax=Streptomyces sp. NPDC056390 TaxID=3345806 RepID=UPI0035E19136